jgi:hypothetical protein
VRKSDKELLKWKILKISWGKKICCLIFILFKRRKSIGNEANQPFLQDLLQTLVCGTKSDLVRVLKKDPKIVTRSINDMGDYPIHVAADAGNPEIVLTLVKIYRYY